MKQNKISFGQLTSAGALSLLLLSACGQVPIVVQPTQTAAPPTSTPTPIPPTNTPIPTPTATPETKKTVAAPTPEIVNQSKADTGGIAIGSLSNAVPDVKSLQTKMTLTLDGTDAGNKVLKGTFDVSLNNNLALKQTELTVGGDLLTPLLADQLRGFSARSLSLYAINNQVYASIQTLLRVCVKPNAAQINVDEIAQSLSLDTFTSMVAANGRFPGTLVGDEVVNGIPSKHYKVDVAAYEAMAAANGMTDLKLKQGDVWLASQGDYVTRLNVSGNGKLSNLVNKTFTGDFTLSMELTGVNNSPEVVLPANCARAIELP